MSLVNLIIVLAVLSLMAPFANVPWHYGAGSAGFWAVILIAVLLLRG